VLEKVSQQGAEGMIKSRFCLGSAIILAWLEYNLWQDGSLQNMKVS
jgi:hypothetical protein